MWKYALLIIVCVVVVYIQVIGFEFVNFDDNELVYMNGEFLSNLSSIGKAFSSSIMTLGGDPSVYYRPLLMVSYVVDYQLWHLNPVGFHLTNVLLHAVTALLVFFLFRRISKNEMAALIAALIFALHPVQTMPVAWVGARNDVLLGLFTVLMMLSHVRYREGDSGSEKFKYLTLLAFALALFTKETAIVFLIFLPLYDLCFTNNSLKDIMTPRYLKGMLVFAGLLGVYLFVRISLFGNVLGTEALYHNSTIWERVVQMPGLLALYGQLIIAPVNLCLAHPLDELLWLQQPGYIVALLSIVGFIALIVWTYHRERVVCFGLGWVAISVLPILNILPLAIPIMEYRLYVPMVGIALAFSWGVVRFLEVTKRPALFRPIGIVLVLILCASSTIRLPVWRNSKTLFADAIQKAPRDGRAYFNLAGYYYDAQQYDSTVTLMKHYLMLQPDNLRGLMFLRQTYYVSKRYADVAELCKHMIRLEPRNPQRYLETGVIYEEMNLPDSAIHIYEEGLTLDSSGVKFHVQLGLLYEKINDPAKAEEHYRIAIQTMPQYGPPYFRLGRLSSTRGDDQAAIRLIEEGMKYWNPSTEVKLFLKSLYEKMGQRDKANALQIPSNHE